MFLLRGFTPPVKTGEPFRFDSLLDSYSYTISTISFFLSNESDLLCGFYPREIKISHRFILLLLKI